MSQPKTQAPTLTESNQCTHYTDVKGEGVRCPVTYEGWGPYCSEHQPQYKNAWGVCLAKNCDTWAFRRCSTIETGPQSIYCGAHGGVTYRGGDHKSFNRLVAQDKATSAPKVNVDLVPPAKEVVAAQPLSQVITGGWYTFAFLTLPPEIQKVQEQYPELMPAELVFQIKPGPRDVLVSWRDPRGNWHSASVKNPHLGVRVDTPGYPLYRFNVFTGCCGLPIELVAVMGHSEEDTWAHATIFTSCECSVAWAFNLSVHFKSQTYAIQHNLRTPLPILAHNPEEA